MYGRIYHYSHAEHRTSTTSSSTCYGGLPTGIAGARILAGMHGERLRVLLVWALAGIASLGELDELSVGVILWRQMHTALTDRCAAIH